MTTVGVAVVAHAVVDGLTWPAAFVLGAIVSPTDPIAATAIARRLGVPRGLVNIVEGESLVNDGTGLVLYRVAVAAVVTGLVLAPRDGRALRRQRRWAASASASSSAGSSARCGGASTTRRRRSRSR